MNSRQAFLLVAAIGLVPVALSYGLDPTGSLGFLFNVPVEGINGKHIFRAIMGLYLGSIIFWIIGVFRSELRQAAICSLVVFMLGLAAGRTLSLVLDGLPSWLLVAYLAVELGLGIMGLALLRKSD